MISRVVVIVMLLIQPMLVGLTICASTEREACTKAECCEADACCGTEATRACCGCDGGGVQVHSTCAACSCIGAQGFVLGLDAFLPWSGCKCVVRPPHHPMGLLISGFAGVRWHIDAHPVPASFVAEVASATGVERCRVEPDERSVPPARTLRARLCVWTT
ncbi:MAG: hypothetical protein K2W85_09050 [Phycisphaerales bacterium]|nr:hypothetical protein [Phycisphaerales bacterium]